MADATTECIVINRKKKKKKQTKERHTHTLSLRKFVETQLFVLELV